MNGYVEPVAVVETNADAFAFARVATWGEREALLNDKEKALLTQARKVIEESDKQSGSVMQSEVAQVFAKFKAYQADQKALADQVAQKLYEIDVLNSLEKDFRGRVIPHEIPAFGSAPRIEKIYASETRVPGLKSVLEGEIRKLWKESNERALTQAVLAKRLESFFNILSAEAALARSRFGGDFRLPPEIAHMLSDYRSLRETLPDPRGGTRENFKSDFLPPAWTWSKYYRSQFGQEFENFFKTARGRLKDRLVSERVQRRFENLKQFLALLDELGDTQAKELGLVQLYRDYRSLRSWQVMRVFTWAVPIVATIAGGSWALFSDDERSKIDPTQVIDVVFAERKAKILCIESVDDQAFRENCRAYLTMKFPFRELREGRMTLEELAKQEEDPRLEAEIKEIFRLRELEGARRAAQKARDAKIIRIAAKEDPLSEAFRGLLILGPSLSEEEKRAGVTTAKKFRDRMLAPKAEKGYLQSRYSSILGAKFMAKDLSGRAKDYTLEALLRETLDMVYEAELLVPKFRKDYDELKAKMEGLGEEATEEALGLLQDKLMAEWNRLDENINSRQNVLRFVPQARGYGPDSLEGDFGDIVAQRLQPINEQVQDLVERRNPTDPLLKPGAFEEQIKLIIQNAQDRAAEEARAAAGERAASPND